MCACIVGGGCDGGDDGGGGGGDFHVIGACVLACVHVCVCRVKCIETLRTTRTLC